MKNIKSLSIFLLSCAGATTISTVSADVVHLDDVIIDGSQCVGFDCVNGESFGFDTQRLKENNLRLHFDDTSTSASFPSNDWRIKVNDTSNGGGNYFAVEDSTAGRTPFRVDAGAPTDALRVDSAGDVGIGVANPVVQLHMKDGNTPTMRLEQDGSSGFTPQTYDVAANESNFFIRDVTNGSKLFFRAQPGAPQNSIYIANDGDIGLGTSAPVAGAQLQVVGNAVVSGDATAFSTATGEVPLSVTADTSSFLIMAKLENANASAGGIAYRMTNGALNIDTNNTGGEYRINFDDGDNQELVLDTDGNLTIDGSITTATQVLPDYVFESDYNLMPLADLQQFISEQKHLPGVPNAKQVLVDQKGSYNMTEMQITLLEKVEELTLYTLEQQARIDEFQKIIDELKAKN